MLKKQSQPLTSRTDPSIPHLSNSTNQVHNGQSPTNDKVQVALRIRPFLPTQDQQQFITLTEDNVIAINKTGIPSLMKFNKVQIENDSQGQNQKSKNKQKQQNNIDYRAKNQEKMFSFVIDCVKSLFQGIQATIFAYGQTGAGKTYTIVGDCPQSGINIDYRPFLTRNNKGIMMRAMQYIINQSRKKRDSRITISFFEVYNEKIYDLLTNNPKPLDIRQSRNGQISIPGLIFVQVTDNKQSLNYIAQGLKNRVTSSTTGNIKSSRSHSIFHIKCQKLVIDKNTNQHDIIVSNLRIVDLAGSEKFNIPHDVSQTQREIRLTQLKSINGSLSKLGHCISALTNQNRTHIPFRDSKLTRILSQSLLGSSKIRLIVCVSPSISAMNETASTLQFADRVKKAIFQRPSLHTQKKKMIQYSQYQSVLQQLQKQRTARQQLQKLVKLSKNSVGELELIRQNDRLRQEVTLLKQQLKVFKNRNKLGINVNLNASRSKSRTRTNLNESGFSPAGIKKSPKFSTNHLRQTYSTKSHFFEIGGII